MRPIESRVRAGWRTDLMTLRGGKLHHVVFRRRRNNVLRGVISIMRAVAIR